jgi:uncharacterized protein YsxB (DUF464 family)
MSLRGMNLIIISMLVFGVLNLIENMIHYNIGRSSDNNYFTFNFPTINDLIKILFVMFIFGLAQGILTEFFIKD